MTTHRDNIAEFEKDIGVSPGFSWDLLNEDDWSFIIKLHALLEAAATQGLALSLDKANLLKIFSLMELSNNRTGKLAFLSALGMLESEQITFLEKLSELRNEIVHDIRNVKFSFDIYLKKLDAQQMKSFITAISYSLKERIEINGIRLTSKKFAAENPKISILLGAEACLSTIYLSKEYAKVKEENRTLMEQYAREYLPRLKEKSEI